MNLKRINPTHTQGMTKLRVQAATDLQTSTGDPAYFQSWTPKVTLAGLLKADPKGEPHGLPK